MPFRLLPAALAACLTALPALAMDATIHVGDAYARASSPSAKAGAMFLEVMNKGDTDDRLIAATSDVAQRVELHTHREDADGVMRMLEIEDGIPVPAGGMALLERGGDHVMLMGLNRPLNDGDTVTVTLSFETAGDVTVEVPVDLKRKPGQPAHGHGHGHKKRNAEGSGSMGN